MTTTRHGHGTAGRHPTQLRSAVAERFADLWAGMATGGRPWTKAVFRPRSGRRFELEFEYE